MRQLGPPGETDAIRHCSAGACICATRSRRFDHRWRCPLTWESVKLLVCDVSSGRRAPAASRVARRQSRSTRHTLGVRMTAMRHPTSPKVNVNVPTPAAKAGPPGPSAKRPAEPPSPKLSPPPKPSKTQHSMFPVSKLEPQVSARKRPPPLPGARLQPPPFPGSLRPAPPMAGARESRAPSRSVTPRAADETTVKTRSNSMVPRTLKPSKR